MTMSKDTNEYHQTYGINHNESKQEIPEQQVDEDFWKIVWYFKDSVKHTDNWG